MKSPQQGAAHGLQVPASHYRPYMYLSPQRMASIGWQLRLMVEHFPLGSVIEVGGGGGLARQLLSEEGFRVTSVDIDPELQPDLVGSLTALPVGNNAYDTFLCCQVLEHLAWSESQVGLRELYRTCRNGGVVSVPTVKRVAALTLFGPRREGFRTINGPHFGPARRRNDFEHHWELEAGVTEKQFRRTVEETGFEIVSELRPYTWFYHHFFVLKKAK